MCLKRRPVVIKLVQKNAMCRVRVLADFEKMAARLVTNRCRRICIHQREKFVQPCRINLEIDGDNIHQPASLILVRTAFVTALVPIFPPNSIGLISFAANPSVTASSIRVAAAA